VREDGRDGEAAGALDVHEEGAGAGYEGLLGGLSGHGGAGVMRCVMLYLQLVLAGLGLRGRVEEIDGENLR